MADYFLLFIATVLVNNFVLVNFLGVGPFLGTSTRLDTAVAMSLATTFVLTLASALSYLVYHWILIPLDLEFLQILSFILVIAVIVQLTQILMRKSYPIPHRVLGVFLPLITTNSAVLGVTILNINQQHNFIESLIFGFAAACGFSLVLILFSGMRERIDVADVPAPFRGAAIALITAGLMSMAFMGFSGLVK